MVPRKHHRNIFHPTTLDSKLQNTIQHRVKYFINYIPFLAYNVIRSPKRSNALQATNDSQGVPFIIQSMIEKVKGLRESYRSLYAAHVPLSELDGNLLAPVGVVMEEVVPVMAAKMNLIMGGCLLCIFIHHSVMDGVGFTTVLRRWACHCKSSQGVPDSESNSELAGWSHESLDRWPLVYGGREMHFGDHPGCSIAQAALQDQTKDKGESKSTLQSMLPMTAAILEFDLAAIDSLKLEAVDYVNSIAQKGARLSKYQ